jgi:transcriptional regulator with XRE-family HTH domain
MAKNMASERVRIGLTQAQMAENVGISSSALFKYEADVSTAPVSVLCKIADLCGCSVDYLLDRTDKRTA